jgi:uncharacterized protein YndB with AHSA1/START domain
MSEQRTVSSLEIVKDEKIDAPIETVWESILEMIGPGMDGPDSKTPMNMRIEPWPGGRWFRDLANKTGHLWGHVQVIKPPKLLEITGPMFMSYAASNFIQYKLAEEGDATRLTFTHQAIGLVTDEHRKGVSEGWGEILGGIRKAAEARAKGAKK